MRDVRLRPPTPPSRGRYDNRPREYQPAKDRAPQAPGENRYGLPSLVVRTVWEIPEPDWIPFNRPMTEMLDVAQKLLGFMGPSYITQHTRGPPGPWVCKYHNQYGHETETCRTVRSALEKLVKEGYWTEFVDRGGGSSAPNESAKQTQTE